MKNDDTSINLEIAMLNLVQSTKNRNVLYKTEIATKTNVNL